MNISKEQILMVRTYKTDKLIRVLFLGTPDFAVNSLEKLATSKFRPILVITQPDKAKGRKQKLQPSPVKISSEKLGLPVLQPPNINSAEFLEIIKATRPDILITVAYGGFLGKSLRKIAPMGCINLHPSLLPALRGASPLQSTLFNNEPTSGITIFKIVASMDAGPIINQTKFDVPAEMNFSEYSDFVAEKGAAFLLETLETIAGQGFELIKQEYDKATYTEKIQKEVLTIDWDSTCNSIIGKIRGLSYQPGARTIRKAKVLQILRAKSYSTDTSNQAGTITQIIKNEGFIVACKDGEILITQVKPEGKNIMSAHAYNLGAKLKLYEKLG